MAMSGHNNNNDDNIVADINMTPLIDIMLVLLIIFMVSSSAAIESGLDVDLPEMNAVSDKTSEVLVVSLSKEGVIAVKGQEIKVEELQSKITELLKELKTESVILEGDTNAPLEQVMMVMDTARSAGAKNFSIAARLKAQN
jgi:biopolymer transport protein ExbD